MIKGALADHVQRLASERTPFVVATVVRARHPTSVRPGDSAVVLADGTIEGFVGGACAESSVRLYALALETGEAVLLRLVPGDAEADGEDGIEGAVVEHNPCLSGGSLDLIEPQLQAARLVVGGSSPIAQAIARVASAAGYEVETRSHAIEGAAAVVVASHGADKSGCSPTRWSPGSRTLRSSRARRGEAVRESLEVPDELRAQLRTPAGLDIGARTPDEIALSVLAQIVAEHHAHPVAEAVTSAADPVCGMEVAITDATPSLERDGARLYFWPHRLPGCVRGAACRELSSSPPAWCSRPGALAGSGNRSSCCRSAPPPCSATSSTWPARARSTSCCAWWAAGPRRCARRSTSAAWRWSRTPTSARAARRRSRPRWAPSTHAAKC